MVNLSLDLKIFLILMSLSRNKYSLLLIGCCDYIYLLPHILYLFFISNTMNTENIGSIIKWIAVIIVVVVVSSFFSIIISDYTDIDPILMSLFLSGISISLGGISLYLGNKSDRKVNSIANANFQRVIGQIEDLRLELKSEELTRNEKGKIVLAPKIITKRAVYSWKCVTYIREANTLLRETKVISSFYIERYFNLFNKYLEQIKEVKELLICEEVHHLLHYHMIFQSPI